MLVYRPALRKNSDEDKSEEHGLRQKFVQNILIEPIRKNYRVPSGMEQDRTASDTTGAPATGVAFSLAYASSVFFQAFLSLRVSMGADGSL